MVLKGNALRLCKLCPLVAVLAVGSRRPTLRKPRPREGVHPRSMSAGNTTNSGLVFYGDEARVRGACAAGISAVMPPDDRDRIPRITRRPAPSSIGSSSCLIKNRELGTIEPSIRRMGEKKFAAARNSRACPAPASRSRCECPFEQAMSGPRPGATHFKNKLSTISCGLGPPDVGACVQ